MKTFLILLLVCTLPLFIWVVVTERIEIRSRAANTAPCWNKVIAKPDGLYWQNGCQTNATSFTTYICKIITTKLTPSEVLTYNAWVNAGRTPIPGCQQTVNTIITRDPPLTGMPNPPPGCHYMRIKCIQAPCEPILACSTITPSNNTITSITSRPSVGYLPTQTPTCIPKPPCVDGIVDPSTGIRKYCDPQPGTVFCTPTPTRTPTPTPPSTPTPTSTPNTTFARITTILATPKNEQSTEDALLADLNHDGYIDNFDLLISLQQEALVSP